MGHSVHGWAWLQKAQRDHWRSSGAGSFSGRLHCLLLCNESNPVGSWQKGHSHGITGLPPPRPDCRPRPPDLPRSPLPRPRPGPSWSVSDCDASFRSWAAASRSVLACKVVASSVSGAVVDEPQARSEERAAGDSESDPELSASVSGPSWRVGSVPGGVAARRSTGSAIGIERYALVGAGFILAACSLLCCSWARRACSRGQSVAPAR